MTSTPPIASINWQTANQQYLAARLARLRGWLERHTGQNSGANGEIPADEAPVLWPEQVPPPALETLCTVFGLSSFEQDVLLLCAGKELDAIFSSLYGAIQGEHQASPTFSLALSVLPDPHWSALSPNRPLRYWRLVELNHEESLTQSPLRIDERVLHYLAGVHHLDDRLRGFVTPSGPKDFYFPGDLVPSHQSLVENLVSAWKGAMERAAQSAGPEQPFPVLHLCGREPAEPIAAAICKAVGLNLYTLHANALPTDPREMEALTRLWEREAVLSGNALILRADSAPGDTAREEALLHWIEESRSPLIVTGSDRRSSPHRLIITQDIYKPTASEQQTLWRTALGDAAALLNGAVDRLTAQFNLNAAAIYSVCSEAETTDTNRLPDRLPAFETIWEACRKQARPRLGNLADAIQPIATWEALVLPETQLQILHEIAIHVRHRTKVYEHWGFAGRSSRGLGIGALFVGSSGTGKTMAAEVLANELHLDLFRIDLSQVVSKYIGETEKNLGKVFDAAESGGAILLFDEADALFGKRSEVKDSHDRYANIEISYLLQRMEAYRGLAILTSNMKNALDNAFLRRIRFVVQFPFPDAAQRAEIWRRVFPAETPTQRLDVQKLARLNVAGGNIHNIALYSAFLAAEADEPVQMEHLLRGARVEYLKLEKPLTAAETRDW